MFYNSFTVEELKNELWKDVGECKDYQDFSGLYEVSNLGRIRSKNRMVLNSLGKEQHFKGKILSLRVANNGYLYACLYSKNKRKVIKPHRAVAQLFLPNPQKLPQVNHKDENKLNNRVSNLEWCTPEYNANYGTRNNRMGKSHSKGIKQYSINGDLLSTYDSITEASKQFSSKNAISNINKCLTGKTKTSYGYVWRYMQ